MNPFKLSCFWFLPFFSFTEDVPKDFRHVSLTGVKQRFEDDTYGQISKEKVKRFFGFFSLVWSDLLHLNDLL